MKGRGKEVFLHFPGTLALALVLFAACAALLYFVLGRYDATDVEAYQQLVYGDSFKTPETTRSVQNRIGLQKNVYFSKDGQPLELALNSGKAELVLLKREGATEFVEHMHDVTAHLQEKVYFVLPDGRHAKKQEGDDVPGIRKEQSILFLQAKNANYHYKDGLFTADTVAMVRYVAPGGHLEDDSQEDNRKDAVALDAGHVVYDGKQVILTDIVHVEHGLADVTGDSMVVDSLEGLEGTHFDNLQITGNVRLDLRDGGMITCDRASLDSKSLLGKFRSGSTQEFVVYTENRAEKGSKDAPLSVKSRKMDVGLVKSGNGLSKMQIVDITADDEVSMTYNDDIVATADHAIYGAGGKVVMLPESGLCNVTNAAGDVIQATRIDVDTQAKRLVFSDANGSLNHSEKIEFSANKLIWDNGEELLTLAGNAIIAQPGVGRIKAAEDVQIKLRTVDGKKVAHIIKTDGDVILAYTDPKLSLDHTVKSYGTLRVDHEKMESRIQSPKDTYGNVLSGRQIFFEDSKGDIYADRVFIKYEYVDDSLSPVRVVLEGNVRITNRLAQSEKDKTPIKQYILADRVDFLPSTKEMIFKAAKGERVLLFDQANDLQVSAPGLKIVRDKATKKETLEGLGDVRMSFAENELNRMRSRFSLDKFASPKAKE